MISYEPLRILLVKEKMNFAELREATGISTRASVRLNNDTGDVTLDYINRICNYLTNKLGRAIGINEILEFIPDVPGPQAND